MQMFKKNKIYEGTFAVVRSGTIETSSSLKSHLNEIAIKGPGIQIKRKSVPSKISKSAF